MKNKLLLFLSLLLSWPAISQTDLIHDSSVLLQEVMLHSFDQQRTQEKIAHSIKVISIANADRGNKTSLLSGLNSLSGVRVEERSPGSYRVNIRGSSLRSPFGVRNIKIYWNDIPFTDPGGNSYFNQFALNNFSYIEVFKGPAGSMYGAGTGGLIQFYNFERWHPGISLDFSAGSYNVKNLFVNARFGEKGNRNQVGYAHNSTDGYRDQSSMRRDNLSWSSDFKISDKHQLTASLLFSDLYYQTPGALTLTEYRNSPWAARPAGGGFPSAQNAKAAIFQKNLTVGFSNRYQISQSISNNTIFYGAFAQVKNSAIRNYERRNEPSAGARTLFSWEKKTSADNSIKITAGSELQGGWYNTMVSKNKNGNPDTVLTNDDIQYWGYNVFLQADLILDNSWFINGGVSFNQSRVNFSRLSNYPVLRQSRTYQNEMAPRVSMRKNFKNGWAVKGTISRGFSPPTVAELLPSTGIISTNLEAEEGWNYEATLIYRLLKNKLTLEATGFYFKLNNALVQRRDVSGADFFINAGDTRQKGIELSADYFTSFRRGILESFILNSSWTLNHFRYGNFVKGADNFSGKTIPSVPARTYSLLADMQFRKGFYSQATYYAASLIYLNDANTAAAAAYHLLGWRIGWKNTWRKKYRLGIYAGADNLLDEKYSLGNDINAAGGRYYNTAAPRNFYAGILLEWIKPSKPAAPPLK